MPKPNIPQCIKIMKSNRSMLVLMATTSMLLAGCSSVHHAGRWEYKITETPQTPEEAKAMRGTSWETREKYLNSLASDGWILVSADGGIFYLRRPKK